jgi:hypothetical protein
MVLKLVVDNTHISIRSAPDADNAIDSNSVNHESKIKLRADIEELTQLTSVMSYNTSTAELELFAHSKYPSVRKEVARHRNTRDRTIFLLTDDKDDTVRHSVIVAARKPYILQYMRTRKENDKFARLIESRLSLLMAKSDIVDEYALRMRRSLRIVVDNTKDIPPR